MIRTFEDPILFQVCKPVDFTTDDLNWLVLKAVCEAFSNGVGLAAPQVGIAKRVVFIYNQRKNGYFMINPIIVEKSNEMTEGIEGCLSYPGYEKVISRSTKITVEYYNEKWEKITRQVDDYEARIILHEYEHLDGISIWNNREYSSI